MAMLIKSRFLLVARMVLLVVLAWQPMAIQAGVPLSEEKRIEREIHRLVNEYREQQGLPPLAYNDAIAAIAEDHSGNMASGKVKFGHGGFQQRYDAMKASLDGIIAGAENVAYGANDAEQVVTLWLCSAGHKKNIEGNFTHTGIGVVRNKDGVRYYTQLFVKMQ